MMGINTIRLHFEPMTTEELLDIWIANDRDEYAEETFKVISEILAERGAEIPLQEKQTSKIQHEDDASIANFFGFKWLISSSLIKLIYIAGMILTTIVGFGYLIEGSVLAGIAILILGNLLWRISCEGFILFFRIHDLLDSIDKKF